MDNKNLFLIPYEESQLKDSIKKWILEAIQESGIGAPINQKKDWGGIELAMEETGLSKSSIYNMVSQRKIPFIRMVACIFHALNYRSLWRTIPKID